MNPRRMIRIVFVVFSFLVLATLGIAQAPQAPAEKKITYVERIDIAHAVAIHAEPHAEKSAEGTMHYVCEVEVVHDDGTVYKQYPYIALINNDDEVLAAIKKSYEVCGQRVVEIVRDYQSYQRALASTVSAKRKP